MGGCRVLTHVASMQGGELDSPQGRYEDRCRHLVRKKETFICGNSSSSSVAGARFDRLKAPSLCVTRWNCFRCVSRTSLTLPAIRKFKFRSTRGVAVVWHVPVWAHRRSCEFGRCISKCVKCARCVPGGFGFFFQCKMLLYRSVALGFVSATPDLDIFCGGRTRTSRCIHAPLLLTTPHSNGNCFHVDQTALGDRSERRTA